MCVGVVWVVLCWGVGVVVCWVTCFLLEGMFVMAVSESLAYALLRGGLVVGGVWSRPVVVSRTPKGVSAVSFTDFEGVNHMVGLRAVGRAAESWAAENAGDEFASVIVSGGEFEGSVPARAADEVCQLAAFGEVRYS